MNYTKIFALATGALLWMSSCSSSSDLDKLPEAAVRTQQAISETVSKLEGHDGYWRLTYYPDTKRAYGGLLDVCPVQGRSCHGALRALDDLYELNLFGEEHSICRRWPSIRAVMSFITSSPLPSTSVMRVVVTSSSS